MRQAVYQGRSSARVARPTCVLQEFCVPPQQVLRPPAEVCADFGQHLKARFVPRWGDTSPTYSTERMRSHIDTKHEFKSIKCQINLNAAHSS